MKFTKYNRTRDASNSTVTSIINSVNDSTNESGGVGLLQPHYIFGNLYDGTQDISGTLGGVTEINGNKDTDDNGITTYSDITVNSGNVNLNGNLNVSSNILGESITATDAKIDELNSTNINTVNGNFTGDLTAIKAAITDLISENITVDNLTVTKLAHFFKLIIDEIKAAGGATLFTPADGFKVDKVERIINKGYKLYWLAAHSDGNAKSNMWKPLDQAICYSFNKATIGEDYNVSNKYYWVLVTEASTLPILIGDSYYHYISISDSIFNGTLNPEVGDNIAMLGYRGADDKERLSAIYISAYSSLDNQLKAPLFAQYKGINDFNLSSHRQSYFDANGAKFIGDFEVSGGLSIDEYINSHQPYIDSTTGNWFIWENGNYVDSGVHAKGTSGYRVEAFTSANSAAYSEGQTNWKATFTIHVWYDEKEITDTLPSTRFVWSRSSEYAAGDDAWNSQHQNLGNLITVTYQDLNGDTSFICQFLDESGTTTLKTIII